MAARRALTDFLILVADEDRSGSVSSAHQRLIRALVPQRERVVPVRSHFDSHSRASPPVSRRRFFCPDRNQIRLRGFMIGWVAIYRSAPCAITAYMRSRRVPLRLRKAWFRPNFLQGRGGFRARTTRMSRSAFVLGPRSHSRMTFKLTA